MSHSIALSRVRYHCLALSYILYPSHSLATVPHLLSLSGTIRPNLNFETAWIKYFIAKFHISQLVLG